MSETRYFPPEPLQQACTALIEAAGSPPAEAAQVSRQLVKANLTGHDSHGVIRLSHYLELVRKGDLVPDRHLAVLSDKGAAAVVSGNWGYGQVVATEAMALAIDKAREHHVSSVAITELNHIGRLADYAVQAAQADMIGMVFTSGGGYYLSVAPFGGAQGRMGTNPIAVAFPSRREWPIVFDMATSALAEGKFKVMVDAHKAAPEGLLIDKEGRPTTNPNDLYDGGAILPVGGPQGYKGYLLNFLVEVLAGLLTGGGYSGHYPREGLNNCTMFIVLDVAAFRTLGDFESELEGFVSYLKATRPQPGGEVLYPGEVEMRRETERRSQGIPLAADTVAALQRELDRYGVGTQLVAVSQLAPSAQ